MPVSAQPFCRGMEGQPEQHNMARAKPLSLFQPQAKVLSRSSHLQPATPLPTSEVVEGERMGWPMSCCKTHSIHRTGLRAFGVRHSACLSMPHGCPFWLFWWKNRWPWGGLIIHQGHLLPLNGHLCHARFLLSGAWISLRGRNGLEACRRIMPMDPVSVPLRH